MKSSFERIEVILLAHEGIVPTDKMLLSSSIAIINHLPLLKQAFLLNIQPSKQLLRRWLGAFSQLVIVIFLCISQQPLSGIDLVAMIINIIHLCFEFFVAYRLTVTIDIENFVEETQLNPRPTLQLQPSSNPRSHSPSLCHSIPE
ncbi:unnamed protein product [Rotaria socialis]|nr:unnamed protein product [Rotaria socialis]